MTGPVQLRLVGFLCAFLAQACPALAQPAYVLFESGPVRPLALSPGGKLLFVANTPDNTLEIFSVDGLGPRRLGAVPVGLEPVAVAARSDSEVWVVNHLSDSVSIVDVPSGRVTRTLLVGDEPRDIVITDPDGAGPLGDRVFVTTAHRGQHRTHASLDAVTGLGSDDGDPELTTPGVGRADVWVFEADDLDQGVTPSLGGVPVGVAVLFGDTPRALAVSADGSTVYAAVFHSGNQTTTVSEGIVCDGFGVAQCGGDGITVPGGLANGNMPGGNPGPPDNADSVAAPEVGLIVQFDETSGEWQDENGRNWTNGVRFDLPDEDVFEIDAASLTVGQEHAHVGTILFNMVVNPVNGNIYVSNTDSQNLTRFEGPGNHGGSTVQGNLAQSRITIVDAGSSNPALPRPLNKHIDYGTLPALAGTGAHSLANPGDMAITSDGATLYVAAFGSSRIGVFDTADLETDTLWDQPPGGVDPNPPEFDPTTESASYLTVSGGGPSGLALDEARGRLYVLTRFDNSLSVVDLGSGNETNHIPLHDAEPESVTAGRHMLYDANKTSSNGEASCSSCHVFGDLDSLAWDLGNPDDVVSDNPSPLLTDQGDMNGGADNDQLHPMKGPMTTQTLRGLANSGAMHWRGDRADGFFGLDDPYVKVPGADTGDENLSFNNFIVAFEGLVGDDTPATNSARQADMQLFTDFALQLALPPNPIRNLDNSLHSGAAAADTFYFNRVSDILFTCDGCHDLAPEDGFFGTGGLSTFDAETQTFKVPHLRNMYAKVGMFGMPQVPFSLPGDASHQGPQVRGFGFLHDGSTDTLFRFFSAVAFQNLGISGFANDTEREEMEQFMLQFDSDLAPIVGQQVTLTAANAAAVGARITLLEDRADATFDSKVVNQQPGNLPVKECDLVVKGRIAGEARGWVYDPAADAYVADRASEANLSPAALELMAASSGQELTYTCAPPGSGVRLGIDRDLDQVRNQDELDQGTDPANPASFAGACSDGLDNDGDGLADLADPGCRDGAWDIENPACDDGFDNDNDGAADTADPQCSSAFRTRETGKKCGLLGFEPFAILAIARVLRRHRS